MDIPVYLFTGFMDSGKTSMITETLLENDFGTGNKNLIIVEIYQMPVKNENKEKRITKAVDIK